jgi:hypothetical protein
VLAASGASLLLGRRPPFSLAFAALFLTLKTNVFKEQTSMSRRSRSPIASCGCWKDSKGVDHAKGGCPCTTGSQVTKEEEKEEDDEETPDLSSDDSPTMKADEQE